MRNEQNVKNILKIVRFKWNSIKRFDSINDLSRIINVCLDQNVIPEKAPLFVYYCVVIECNNNIIKNEKLPHSPRITVCVVMQKSELCDGCFYVALTLAKKIKKCIYFHGRYA